VLDHFGAGRSRAILNCQAQSTFVPSKVVLRLTRADITLIDRQSRKLIWRASKLTSFDTARLAAQPRKLHSYAPARRDLCSDTSISFLV
jgi:hypothetical protein